MFYQCSSRVVGLIKTDPNGLVTPSRPPRRPVPRFTAQSTCPRLLVDLVHLARRALLVSGEDSVSSPRSSALFPTFFRAAAGRRHPHRRPPPPVLIASRAQASARGSRSRVHRARRARGVVLSQRQVESVRRVGGPPPWVFAHSRGRARGKTWPPRRSRASARRGYARDAQGVVVRHSDSGPVPPARVVRVRARGVALVRRARRRRPRTRREATRRLARRGHRHRLRHRQRGRPRRTRPSPSPSRPARRRSPPRTRT